MDKKQLRSIIREKKRAMTQEEIREKSRILMEKLLKTQLYQNAGTIYGYLSYNQEVQTLPILAKALEEGKRVAVPKVYGEEMRFLYLEDLSLVAPGFGGIPEPIADSPVAEDPHALVLMPGLAFDREGHRIGYGGGFYDRFLAKEPEHPTVALCYEFQMVEDLPVESFDSGVRRLLSGGQGLYPGVPESAAAPLRPCGAAEQAVRLLRPDSGGAGSGGDFFRAHQRLDSHCRRQHHSGGGHCPCGVLHDLRGVLRPVPGKGAGAPHGGSVL